MRRLSITASALTALTACSAPDAAVVDPFDPAVLPRISLTEQAQISSGADAEEYMLHQVSRAVVLGTGEIAVANVNSEILVFGPEGGLRRKVGRSGGGPGEFRFLLNIVRLDDDRILAWDPAQARVSVFRQDGQLDYVCTPQGVDLAQVGGGFVGAFGDGSFVLQGRSSSEIRPEAPDGLRRDTIPFLLFDRSGELVRTIGEFARPERLYGRGSGYTRYLLDTSVNTLLSSGKLLVGDNDSMSLMQFDSSGTSRAALRLARNPRPVTEADIEAGWQDWMEQRVVAREQMLGQAMMTLDEAALHALRDRIRGEVEADLTDAKRRIEPAGFLPAYKSLIVGSAGTLWMEDYLSPTSEVSRWILLDSGFSPAGWIELRPNERLLAAGPDIVVVLRKDELDVESVVILSGVWSATQSSS